MHRTTDACRIECFALVDSLNRASAMPRFFQVSRRESISIVNVSENPFVEEIMSPDTFVGISNDKFKSLSIALTEFVERKVARNNPAFPRANEGVAGRSIYPDAEIELLTAAAARSAGFEAIERFVWANWWDHKNLHFTVSNLSHAVKESTCYPLAQYIQELFPGGQFILVRPTYFSMFEDSVVCIVLYFLKNGAGVLSGGACGGVDDLEHVLFRSLAELIRHATAVFNSRANHALRPSSFYDERLLFFASPEGAKLTRRRLEVAGQDKQKLPRYAFDRIIEHSLQDSVILYQRLFENQPEFLGGDLKRLCI